MAWATLAKTNPYCANDRNAVEDPFHSAEDVCVRCISYLEPDNPSAGSASLLLVKHAKYTLPRLPRVHGTTGQTGARKINRPVPPPCRDFGTKGEVAPPKAHSRLRGKG
jgi:hypothetical protein